MSGRNWLHVAALGGLAASIIVAVWYALASLSPEPPYKAADGANKAVGANYYPGGSNCRPEKLAAVPPGERQARTDSCAEAAEQRRQYEESANLNRRAVVAAEGATGVAYATARLGLWQVILGILTTGAAVWAAYAASRAAAYAKEAAIHTDAGSVQAKRSADAAVAIQRPWVDVEVEVAGPAEIPTSAAPHSLLEVPLRVKLINRGGTPARFVCDADGASTHAVHDYEIERNWPFALERASQDSKEGRGVTLFPGEENAREHNLPILFNAEVIETDEGMFFIAHGLVVVYQWGDDEVGITKITGEIIIEDERPEWPDGWRLNLPALKNGEKIAFKYERHRFMDSYT